MAPALPRPPAPAGFDPFSQAYLADPHRFWQTAREERVFYYGPIQCWVLSRYEDVAGAFRDWETFSSRVLRPVPLPEESRRRVPAEVQAIVTSLMDHAIVNIDPPEHTMHRKNVQKAFTRPLVAANEPMIRELAAGLVEGFAPAGGCELMGEFCHPLTIGVITSMLGLPDDLLGKFHSWIDDLQGLVTVQRFEGSAQEGVEPPPLLPAEELERRYQRVGEVYPHFQELLAERRANPTDDLITAMLMARNEDGTAAMTDDYILGHMVSLALAGSETTADLLGQMVMFFAERPDVLAQILAEPDLWEPAIEEGLRRWAVANNQLRVTTRDVEIGDVTIPARSAVLLNIAGADSDAEVFPDPLAFDLRRENVGDHIGFGLGRHFCTGAPLARLEARCALQELYGRLSEIAVDPGQELEYKPAVTIRGLKSLRVSW
ncbi:MAG: cytochrome P450 [Actinobacteria bacterium]|nr:cytochrome P450 [Actinomycetota bacterium]